MLSREECVSLITLFLFFVFLYLINYVTSSSENGTPFVVAGTGKPLRQFVYSNDLAKMFIWQLREYDDVEPIIFSVGEDEDVSIRYVAEQIVKAYGFTGEVKVRVVVSTRPSWHADRGVRTSSTQPSRTGSSASRRRMKSCSGSCVRRARITKSSSLRRSRRALR